ncbi:MAG: translation initiation factor IF-2 [Clostridia bacterium]|nr:translation initiation factor IF-2 [Clostridia bacterium]
MGVNILGKIKIYDLAKELNLASKELLQKVKEMGIEAKSHLSSISDEDVEKIRKNISKKTVNDDSKKKENKNVATKGKKDEKETPVIIRREVIIEEDNKKEVTKKQETKQNKNPFVQRKDKKDFNIVYRNRPEKPLTVSELFGLNKGNKKEEPKKEEVKETKEVKEVKKIEPEIKKEENIVIKKEEKKQEMETKKIERNPQFTQNREERNRDNNYQNTTKSNGFRDRNYDRPNNFRDRNNNYRDRNNNDRSGNNFVKDRKNGFKTNNERPNGDRPNGFNKNNKFGGRRPLDERGIEKNIKDIMASDIVEKESREYNKTIDKQKNNNKFDDNRNNNKKKSRRNQNEDINQGKLKNLKQHDRLSNMFEDSSEDGMLEYYDLTTQRGRKGKKKNVKDENRNKQKIFKLTEITIPESISVKDLAAELKKTSGEVIMKLMSLGIMATLNNDVDFDTAFLVAEEFGVTAIKKEEVKEEDILFDDSEDKENELQERPPVVVVMGHVDHGKTSLLDAVRKTNVIEGEAGGITQAIGAYKVKVNDREITFLDTPGHEALTAMRARGAQITDIAILVVAANDGVMPQTVEAINHAKSANIPIIVAVNKIDLPDANPQKVKEELMQYELVPEEWGGDTIFVEISAKKNINIDQLLEMVLLQADVLELKANPNKQAKGVVIEARLDKGKGAIASLLVQRGKLDTGDTIVVGSTIGRIRSMVNDKGKKVKSAGPSTPVEIMGLTEVPQAGDVFYEVKDEKMAKHLIERRKRQEREKSINAMQAVTLDNLFSQMEKGNLKQLNLIVKADVQGSVEALKQSLEKLSDDEVRVKVIHAAAGAVTESDVTLAKVSNAIIIAFNVRPVATAKQEADKDEVQIKQYSVIYNAIEDVEAAMKGMLDPKFEEELIGTAEVRQVFKISNVGTVAGCMVLSGKIERNAGVRVIRDDVVIHEGKLVSLKRFKDDVKEVAKDFECGIQIEKYNDLKENDIIEAFVMKEIKR